MKRQLKRESNIPRRIVRLLSATGISVALAMVALAVWMSRTVEEQSVELYQKLVQSALEDQLEHLRLITQKDIRWGAGHQWISEQDADRIYLNIATSTTESGYFDFSFIYDADDTLLYAYEFGGDASDLSIPPPSAAPALIDQVRRAIPESSSVTTGFIEIDGMIAAVAAAEFPRHPRDTTRQGLPILMNIVMLNDDIFHHVADGFDIHNLSLKLGGVPATSSNITIELIGSDKQAHLSWEQPKSGTILLRQSLGAIAAICALTALAHFIVGRITMRLAQAFLRESFEARNDRLTGLLNRAGFEEELDSRRVQNALQLNRLALVLLDMDRFKEVNDTYGHAAGDQALQVMSQRIQAIGRRNDIAARMGGDEFILVIIDDNPQAIVTLITGRIAEAGREAVKLADGVEVAIQASMGAAISKPGVSMRELMMTADAAMYEAKTARAFWYDSQNQESDLSDDKEAVGEILISSHPA